MRKGFALLALGALAWASVSRAPGQVAVAPAPDGRPNVIIILADDLGYSDLGCFGGEAKTPNLDTLAREGVRFTNFYNNARCCPTRASILTGLYPHQAGVGAMTHPTSQPAYAGRLKPTAPTIAEVLKAAGYHTAAFGKWHVANTIQRPDHMKDLNRQTFPDFFAPIEQYPTRRGFEEYFGGIWGVVDYFNPFSLVDGEKPVKELPAGFYMTDAINAHAADYIRRQAGADRPFFIYLAHNAPHWPLHALPEDIEKYRDEFNDGYDAARTARYARMVDIGLIDPKTAPLPATLGKGWAELSAEEKHFRARLFQTHLAMIDRMDQGLGGVFQALKETGRWENTLILFLSDNGASAERFEDAGFDRSTIARDGKPIQLQLQGLRRNARRRRAHLFHPSAASGRTSRTRLIARAKMSQYNGGERAPFIAHWPAGIKAAGRARSFDAPGHVIDLDGNRSSISPARRCPRRSAERNAARAAGHFVSPAARRRRGPAGLRPTLFGEHEGGRSVLTPDGWKLIRDRGESEWHLYHVAKDETESEDLIAQQPERAAAMQAMWNKWADENNVLPKP